ncbi:hypothetical protein R1sor_004191 [Riccia sorocarpa]|uniref:Uncharacterized protein n=1 Tax=Riccia sorocarpa TaxID=122646 RepID=A0ABD3H7P9_9MARC
MNTQLLQSLAELAEERDEHQGAIILLQELKVKDKTKLMARLRALSPDAYIDVDYTPSGRGGAAVIIPKEYRVTGGVRLT